MSLNSIKTLVFVTLVRVCASLKKTRPGKFFRSLIRPIRTLFRRYLNPLGTILVEAQGYRMYVDTRDIYVAQWLAVHGVWEPHQTPLFRRLAQPGMTVVDVGANVGYYTLIAGTQVGPAGRVLGFEPDPEHFALLKKNVQLNGLGNVTLFNKALSRVAGSARLFLARDNLADHRLFDGPEGRQTVNIDMVRLDDVLPVGERRIDLLKVDTQGSDLAVLDGMGSLLEENPEIVVLIEFWPGGLRRFGDDPGRFLSRLMEADFSLFEVLKETGRIEPFDGARFLAHANDRSEADLLCLRSPSRLEALTS